CARSREVTKNGPLDDETSLERLSRELLHPNLWISDHLVIIQLTFLHHLDGKVLIADDNSLISVKVVLTDVEAVLLAPIVLAAPKRDGLAFIDVGFIESVRPGTRQKLEVVILQICRSIEVLQ